MLEMRVLSVQSEIKLQVHVLESNYMYHKKVWYMYFGWYM